MSWPGAADVAVHQHLHIKHMFKCYLKKRQQNIICGATGCLVGGRGMLREETGILAGKSPGHLSREQRSGRHPSQGQGWHGCMPGGTREEDIPRPSTHQRPPLPNLLHGFDSQVGRVGNELMNCNCARRERETEPVLWAGSASDLPPQVGSHGKVVKKSYSNLNSLGGKGCTHGK